jgi:hypothetical protein
MRTYGSRRATASWSVALVAALSVSTVVAAAAAADLDLGRTEPLRYVVIAVPVLVTGAYAWWSARR